GHESLNVSLVVEWFISAERDGYRVPVRRSMHQSHSRIGLPRSIPVAEEPMRMRAAKSLGSRHATRKRSAAVKSAGPVVSRRTVDTSRTSQETTAAGDW